MKNTPEASAGSEEPRPEIKTVDYDTVRLYCPKSDKYLSFHLKFPSGDAFEEFLKGPFSKERAKGLGGYTQLETPYALSTNVGLEQQADNQEAGVKVTDHEDFARTVGVTKTELLRSNALAWKAILNGFASRRGNS